MEAVGAKTIHTARLTLIVVSDADLTSLQSGRLPPGLRLASGYTMDHLNLASQTATDTAKAGVAAGVVLLNLDSEIIGHVVFHADRRRPEVITVSYEVAQPFWNKRYASESVPPLVDDLLANADVIRAEVMRGDVRSKKVLARAGLARTDERGFGEIWERRRL